MPCPLMEEFTSPLVVAMLLTFMLPLALSLLLAKLLLGVSTITFEVMATLMVTIPLVMET
jgi:hypothetical protein